MKLRIKKLKFLAGRPVCMIHEKTALKLNVRPNDRISITNKNGKSLVSILDTVSYIINPNEIAVSEEITDFLNLKEREEVKIEIAERPPSIFYIKEKLKGKKLTKKEVEGIIMSIANNSLTESEIAFFIASVYIRGMSIEEIKYLIEAMVKTGKKLELEEKIIADKHCIGGIAGNRTTPIVVSICGAAGLTIPKTSSRAITSAAGTADVIEVIAKVDFSIQEIKRILRKTKACMVWGGALGLAPVDDKIIKIERILNIDSKPQLLASILSKKLSVNSKYILIDIPYGKSAKFNKSEAEELKEEFLKLAKIFGLKMRVVLTPGSEPIGRGIGPLEEMKDVLRVLKNEKEPSDLKNKSIFLAGELLELTKKAKKGEGIKIAKKILESGRAFEKFKEIIKAQKGDLKNLQKFERKKRFSHDIKAEKEGKIKHLDNWLINRIARLSGCPEDKVAGIYLWKKKNEIVKKNESIMSVYSLSKEKLKHAIKFYEQYKDKVIEFY